MSKTEQDNKSGLLPSWLETGTVTALLIPLFYTAGWSYAYHYFERFNLGLMGLDIPREYFFVHSFQAVKDQALLFLLTLLGFVALLVFGRVVLERMQTALNNPLKSRMLHVIPALILPIMIFGMFAVFYHIGETAAVNVHNRQVKNDFDAYLRVKVWVSPPEKAEYSAEMAAEWQKGCYRLLMRTKDHVFVFQPQKSSGKIPTDMIPSGKVELIRMLPVNESCP